jgi:hypothetical protein
MQFLLLTTDELALRPAAMMRRVEDFLQVILHDALMMRRARHCLATALQ